MAHTTGFSFSSFKFRNPHKFNKKGVELWKEHEENMKKKKVDKEMRAAKSSKDKNRPLTTRKTKVENQTPTTRKAKNEKPTGRKRASK